MTKQRPAPTEEELKEHLPIVCAFIEAALIDEHYAASIAYSAMSVKRKRRVWAERIKYRQLSGTNEGHPPAGWTFADAISVMEDSIAL